MTTPHSVAATIKTTASGDPVCDLTGTGEWTSVESAARLGYLVNTPDGYVDPGSARSGHHRAPADATTGAYYSVASSMRHSPGANGGQLVDLTGRGDWTSCEAAVAMGALRRLPSGQYVDIASAAAGAIEGAKPWSANEALQEAEPADAEPAAFHDDSSEAVWQAAVAPLPQEAFDVAGQRMAAAIYAEDPTAALAEVAAGLSREAGIEPEAAAAIIETGAAFYQDLADRYLCREHGAAGAELEGFYAWVRAAKARELPSATQDFIATRSMSRIVAWLEEYRDRVARGAVW